MKQLKDKQSLNKRLANKEFNKS